MTALTLCRECYQLHGSLNVAAEVTLRGNCMTFVSVIL